MKSLFITCFTFLAFGATAQNRENVKVNIPAEGISLTADNISLTNDGCTLDGHVTQGPIYKNLPLADEHKVVGVLTQINQIGGTWVIQCNAGPGYCFIWYSK